MRGCTTGHEARVPPTANAANSVRVVALVSDGSRSRGIRILISATLRRAARIRSEDQQMPAKGPRSRQRARQLGGHDYVNRRFAWAEDTDRLVGAAAVTREAGGLCTNTQV